MTKIMKAGLIGCGDYLRWEVDPLNESKFLKVKSTFDLDSKKSERIAGLINATAVTSDDAIFDDPEIEVVLIFTPPWVRKGIFKKAVNSGKHIITTKPFGSNLNDANELFNMVDGKVQCAVFYGRSGNAAVEMMKKIFNSDEIGNLALYKEDWLHHYPTWNQWATDPEKNGGPFLDAMVHNLNKSRYLIGSKVKDVKFISNNFTQSLKCNDTEMMKVDFDNGASSVLFITWAADLEVFDQDGNDRVHYGIQHLITSKGWYVTEETINNKPVIKAVKEKEVKIWEVEDLPYTRYDNFAVQVQNGEVLDSNVADALIDMEIMDKSLKNK